MLKDLTPEEQERLIGLEARMRGISKDEMNEQFKQFIEPESISQKQHFHTLNQNSSNLVEQQIFPSRNESDSSDIENKLPKPENQFFPKRIKKPSEHIITPKKKQQISKNQGIQAPYKKITEYLCEKNKKKLSDKKKKVILHHGDEIEVEADEIIKSLQDELQNAHQSLIEKDLQLKEKLKQIDIMMVENKELKDHENCIKENLQVKTDRLYRAVETLKVLLVESEKYRRAEIRYSSNQMKMRYGEFELAREGSKITEVWVDGQEIKDNKFKLIQQFPPPPQKQIDQQKDELERRKKLKLRKEDEELNRVSIALKMAMLQKEEMQLNETLERLENEKHLFIRSVKRQFEEDHSRYGKLHLQGLPWPILGGDRYQILGLLGQGGFSEVYRAFDTLEIREVACKLHQLNPTWSELSKTNYIKHALRETKVHSQLTHQHIVKLYDCVEMDQNCFCTVLEYCDSPDLSFYLKKYRTFHEREAKLIIMQILSALKYLNNHRNKVIHYDLKPQNILFHQGEIKISDFGLCKVLENEETRLELTSQGVGTYWYLPPECFQTGEMPPAISSKVDVWSVGVIFYEMLFGVKPFGQGVSQEKILKDQVILLSRNVQFPQKPIISQECKDFIKGCLSYSQMDRLDVHGAVAHIYFTKRN